MSSMKYKGYVAVVAFSDEDEVFVGRILGIADHISFHGESVRELKKELKHAVDHYLADCRATGRKPLKPASGKLLLRVPPETHAAAAIAAEASGKSLNQWASETLAKAAEVTLEHRDGV